MSLVAAIVRKDIKQISRNRFTAVITFLSIFAFAAIYYLMPADVDETFEVGLFLERGREALEQGLEKEEREGLEVTFADSPAELRRLVREREVQVGFEVLFPNGEPQVTQYVSSETPEEIREAGEVFGREFGFLLLGRPLPVEMEQQVIGVDMAGSLLPLRDSLRVLLLTAVLMIEVFALSDLLAAEIRSRTVRALLVTPADPRAFLSAKAVTGISLGLGEGLLAGLLLRIITLDTALGVIAFLLAGAVLVTALAFLIGSAGREMMSIIGLSTVAYIVLLLPGFTLIFPGLGSPLMRAIPTEPFIRAIDGLANRGQTLDVYLPELAYLTAYGLAFFALGYLALKARLK
jgi:ABC-2 type transport system permease protein